MEVGFAPGVDSFHRDGLEVEGDLEDVTDGYVACGAEERGIIVLGASSTIVIGGKVGVIDQVEAHGSVVLHCLERLTEIGDQLNDSHFLSTTWIEHLSKLIDC